MPNLKYPLVCFDLDGTLVDDTVFIWSTLHETFGTDPVSRNQAKLDYFSRTITYRQWFEHDLRLLRAAGATLPRMKRVIETLSPMPGAFALLDELKSRGHKLAVVSGSLDLVVNELFGAEVFDFVLINRISFNEDGTIAGGIHTPFDFEGKAEGLRQLASKMGVGLGQTVFVGDNENDVWIAKAAGLSIAFNCKSDALRMVCDAEVKEPNLMQLSKIIC